MFIKVNLIFIILKERKPKKIKKDNIIDSRKKIFNNKNQNLNFLLEKIFKWIQNFFLNKKIIIELGAGSGCIKKIKKIKNYIKRY